MSSAAGFTLSFRPRFVNPVPYIDLAGQLPQAIDNAIGALIRAREDMMQQRNQAHRERASMLAGMVAGAQFMGALAGALRVDQEQHKPERQDQ